ncbi:MAG: uracil-DNA glycosylase family protein [Bacteroidales bacterium]|nr:uracil-DNA glycosylase family protein [Bacteroidales bacterium]
MTDTSTNTAYALEKHPLEPFLPQNARILMLGSFPPKHDRWSMEFFYPNFINDMWRIMGTIFYKDRNHFITAGGRSKKFDKEKIIEFCNDKGIALYDTATQIRRLKDNASDKFLEIVTPSDIQSILEQIPLCRTVVTTGQKATDVVVKMFGCKEPPVGGMSIFMIKDREINFWRMPSSSRAYPLNMEKKTECYRIMFEKESIL